MVRTSVYGSKLEIPAGTKKYFVRGAGLHPILPLAGNGERGAFAHRVLRSDKGRALFEGGTGPKARVLDGGATRGSAETRAAPQITVRFRTAGARTTVFTAPGS